MARKTKRLSSRFVSSVSAPGLYADGDGLYLIVESKTAKRWTFVYQWHGRRREMGLGSVSARTLGDAREATINARRQVASGVDPIEARRQAAADARANKTLFGEFAERLVNDLAPQFRNQKHINQWRMTLSIERDESGRLLDSGYCLPLRPMRLAEIDTAAVLTILRPIWQSKPETAARLRGRIERVLDAAKVAGLRSGENPARWRGHLDAILPKRQRLTRGHHAAMPYAEVPAFMGRLATVSGVGALALRFTILAAARTGETMGATWAEIDLEKEVWTIPAARMKAGREHRVPLSDAALTILRELHETRTSELVFNGRKPGRPISNRTMTKALESAGAADYTTHGFRSSFRDWAGELTAFPRDVAEAALAHRTGDATELAYRRGDALAKRRKLMDAWAAYCLASNVVPMSRGKRAG
jgi:integrase